MTDATERTLPQQSHCPCGRVSLDITGLPLVRIACHCSICRAFNEAPFADLLVFRARDVARPAPGLVNFRAWRPPPNVRRGACSGCGKPALELFRAPPLPSLAMFPTANLGGTPPPLTAHIFYDNRVADVDDGLPRHSGYWPSQWAFMKLVFAGLRGR